MSDVRANDVLLTVYGIEGCGCQHCVHAVVSKRPWPHCLEYPFIACESCGNKRCPKATHHDNACTGSNAYGQPGSSYGGI